MYDGIDAPLTDDMRASNDDDRGQTSLLPDSPRQHLSRDVERRTMLSDDRVPVYDGITAPLPDDMKPFDGDKYVLPDSPPKLLVDDAEPPVLSSDIRVALDDGIDMMSPLRPEDDDNDDLNQSNSPPRMNREDTAHSLVRRVLGYVICIVMSPNPTHVYIRTHQTNRYTMQDTTILLNRVKIDVSELKKVFDLLRKELGFDRNAMREIVRRHPSMLEMQASKLKDQISSLRQNVLLSPTARDPIDQQQLRDRAMQHFEDSEETRENREKRQSMSTHHTTHSYQERLTVFQIIFGLVNKL